MGKLFKKKNDDAIQCRLVGGWYLTIASFGYIRLGFSISSSEIYVVLPYLYISICNYNKIRGYYIKE